VCVCVYYINIYMCVCVCVCVCVGGAERAVPKDLLTGAALGERERQVS
jgi:hypothetical protein